MSDPNRQLARWLIQLHAVEQQALFALRRARRLIGDEVLSGELERHIEQTLRHRALVRERLAALGARGTPALDAAVTLNRMGFLTFTALSPDAPGKLLVDSVAYEFLEIAAYRMLAELAECRGDAATQAVAGEILADEEEMAQRLSGGFDRALAAARRRADGSPADSVSAHLRDAHALETQAMVLMGMGSRVAGAPALSDAYRARAGASARQRAQLGRHLHERDSAPARHKDTAMATAGLAWAAVWTAQRDTPAKLLGFAYAATGLEIAAYELLARESAQAGDEPTRQLAGRLLEQERDGARRLAELLPTAVRAILG